jgi:hypothetical protein
VPISSDLRFQILPSLSDLPKAQKHQSAAFIADKAILVLWDDEPANIIERAKKIQSLLVKLILTEKPGMGEKSAHNSSLYLNQAPSVINSADSQSGSDVEKNLVAPQRPIILINACIVALTIALLIVTLSTGWKILAVEVAVDGGYLRLALLAVVLVLPFLSLVCSIRRKPFFSLTPGSSFFKLSL